RGGIRCYGAIIRRGRLGGHNVELLSTSLAQRARRSTLRRAGASARSGAGRARADPDAPRRRRPMQRSLHVGRQGAILLQALRAQAPSRRGPLPATREAAGGGGRDRELAARLIAW